MKREQVKSILSFCKFVDGETSFIKKVIKDYEDEFYIMSSKPLDGIPKSKTNKVSKPTETLALNIPEYVSIVMRELQSKVEDLYKLKPTVLRELNRLPLEQKTILYNFYIRGDSWTKISMEISYCETQCKKIRNKALDKLGEYFDDNNFINSFEIPNI